MEDGFIVVPNSLLDSDVWNKREKYNKLDAYIYLVKDARWQRNKIKVKDIVCGHNQLVCSYSELMAAWNLVNQNEVKRLLDFLKNGGWIDTQKFKNATLITILKNDICNKNVTTFVTANVTPNVTDNRDENQAVTPPSVTPNVTPNVTGVLQQEQYSHAQVVLNLFDDSNCSSDNIDNKEKTKEKQEKEEICLMFKSFCSKYRSYGGKVRGFQTELNDFKKKHKDWKEVIPMLEYAIDKENKAREAAKNIGKFFASMQNLKTYLNQRSWEAYSDGYENYDPNAYHPDGFNYDAEFDAYRFYNYIPNHDLLDGYTDDNRPDGARIVEQITVWVWSREQRRWNKELKK